MYFLVPLLFQFYNVLIRLINYISNIQGLLFISKEQCIFLVFFSYFSDCLEFNQLINISTKRAHENVGRYKMKKCPEMIRKHLFRMTRGTF